MSSSLKYSPFSRVAASSSTYIWGQAWAGEQWAETVSRGHRVMPAHDDQGSNEIFSDTHTSCILFYFILIESLGNASCFINILLFSDQSTTLENLINR